MTANSTAYMNAYMRERRKCPAVRREDALRSKLRGHERRRFMAGFKLMLGCVDCGYAVHPEALDFDHVRGVKVANPTKMRTYAWATLIAELEKCDVRCANCHRVRTCSVQKGGE